MLKYTKIYKWNCAARVELNENKKNQEKMVISKISGTKY